MPRHQPHVPHGALSRARAGCDCHDCRHTRRLIGRREDYVRKAWERRPRKVIAEALRLDPADVSRIAKRLGLPPKNSGPYVRQPCGTEAAYQRGCRCGACQAAHADYQVKGRRATGHGSVHMAATGCTCQRCARTRRRREARHRDTPAHAKHPASAAVRVARENYTGHGSLARAKAGCDCPRCEKALAEKHQPNGPPMWRCGCDPYRLNAGDVTTCPACGTVPGWATNRERRKIS